MNPDEWRPGDGEEADSTAQRLMTAALRLIGDRDYHGATTRAIAAEAGVSEVTLFRRFRSKDELVAAALTMLTEDFRSAGAEPTEDVAADLIRLGESYQRFVDQLPGLVARLLAEVAAQSEIGGLVARLIADNAESAALMVEHHQQAGRLVPAPPEAVLAAFLGPILLGATIGGVGVATPQLRSPSPMDVVGHTRRFLEGYRTSGWATANADGHG